jgi:hypothetical protein
MKRIILPVLLLLVAIGGSATHGQSARREMADEGESAEALFTQLAPPRIPEDTLVSTTVPVASEAEMAGYYPTAADLALLGDKDYPRSGSTQGGPDARSQLASGIFMYESGEQDFYARNRDFFAPVNQVLGVFTPHKAFTMELPNVPLAGVTFDAGFPLFTRTFEPENAHLKAGPLAFDLLWLGAGALWSDYKGPITFAEGAEDGWISYLDLGVRGMLKITDTIYLSVAANIIYLPGSNELAFRVLNNSSPAAAIELFYQKRLGDWDLLFFDRFRGRPGIDVFAELQEGGIDRAGRYQFGFGGGRDRIDFFSNDSVWFTNQIAARASTMVGSSDWRFQADADHFDFWRSYDFEDHATRDALGLQLGYEGNEIHFAPSLSYRVSTFDGFESFFNRLQLELNGRITENIRASAMGGYLWTSGIEPERSNGLWQIGVNHNFSERGSHGVNLGQQLFEDPFSPEVLFTTYYRYFVNYQLAQRLNAAAYAQYSDGERIVSRDPRIELGDVNFYTLGGSLTFQPLDFTRIIGSIAYQRNQQGDVSGESERWFYRLQLVQQLGSRLTLQTLYQFQDYHGSASFNEHLVSMSLRWYF